MSDLKCPFCQQKLIPCVQNQNDWLYHCDNQKCPMYDDADIENAKHPLASEDLWQELIRTRKALDVAVDALKKYTDASGNWWYGYEFQGHYEDYAGEYADKALEQITALEQKD